MVLGEMNVQVNNKQRISLCKYRLEPDPGLIKMFVGMFVDIQSVDMWFFTRLTEKECEHVLLDYLHSTAG